MVKRRILVGLGALALAFGVVVSSLALLFAVLDWLAFHQLAGATTGGAALSAPSADAPGGSLEEDLARLARRREERERELEKRRRELQRAFRRQAADGRYAQVYSQGNEVDVEIPDSHALAMAVLKLARGSVFAASAQAPEAAHGLQVSVRYDPPISLPLPTPAYRMAVVSKLTLVSTAADEDGWPSLYASTDFATWFLGRCKGPIVAEMLCLEDLAPHLPPTAASKCEARRRGHPL